MRIEHGYKPSKLQYEIHESPARFKVAVIGRRGGKSKLVLNEGNIVCCEKTGAKAWIVTPTYGLAKDIYWRDKKMEDDLVPEAISSSNKSEMVINYINGSVLQFKGAENTKGLVGSGLDFLACDEVAKWTYWQEAWEQNLRPTLADRNGRVIFCSTPQGFNHFYDLFIDAKQRQEDGDPNYAVWQVPTWESGAPWVDTYEGKAFLEAEKNKMSEDMYMQEYGAQFRKFTGLVYKDFDRSVNVKDFETQENLMLEVGLDFGSNHPTAGVYGYWDEKDGQEILYIVDEYYRNELPMRDHVGGIMAKRNIYKNPLRWYVGDSAAQQQIMECQNYGLYVVPVNKERNSVTIGISRLQELIKVNPVTKIPSLIIHSRCTSLLYEIERYRWRESKGNVMRQEDNKHGQGMILAYDPKAVDKPVKEGDDLMDALRYLVLHHRKKQKISLRRKIKPYKPASVYDLMR